MLISTKDLEFATKFDQKATYDISLRHIPYIIECFTTNLSNLIRCNNFSKTPDIASKAKDVVSDQMQFGLKNYAQNVYFIKNLLNLLDVSKSFFIIATI